MPIKYTKQTDVTDEQLLKTAPALATVLEETSKKEGQLTPAGMMAAARTIRMLIGKTST